MPHQYNRMDSFIPSRRRIAAAALGLALGLPSAASASVQAMPLWNTSLPRGAALDFTLNPAAAALLPEQSILAALLQGQWREYARNRLVPEMGVRVDLDPLPDRDQQERRDAFLPMFAHGWMAEERHGQFGIGIERSRIRETPMLPNSLNEFRLESSGLGFDRTLLSPTYSFQLNDRSRVGLSAILAYQQFSTFGFGHVPVDHVPVDESGYAVRGQESSMGAGIRLGLSSELAPGLSVGAAYQSRIEMDPFMRYRGVYSEPGEFDIPASANLGLALDTTGQTTLTFDVRHIQYSDVKPFTSRLLPNRFLALLGDGTSPRFAWQDLTVFQVGWQWQNNDEDLAWHVNWSSGRQPTPTSDVLARALAPEFSDEYWQLGVTQVTGDRSRVSLAASYTPSDYFLSLDGRGFEADGTLDRVELEARWSIDF